MIKKMKSKQKYLFEERQTKTFSLEAIANLLRLVNVVLTKTNQWIAALCDFWIKASEIDQTHTLVFIPDVLCLHELATMGNYTSGFENRCVGLKDIYAIEVYIFSWPIVLKVVTLINAVRQA